MKIVVTGGSGLAGFAVVRHLLECGHEVVSLDPVSYTHLTLPTSDLV